jgi:hypothetical protein
MPVEKPEIKMNSQQPLLTPPSYLIV